MATFFKALALTFFIPIAVAAMIAIPSVPWWMKLIDLALVMLVAYAYWCWIPGLWKWSCQSGNWKIALLWVALVLVVAVGARQDQSVPPKAVSSASATSLAQPQKPIQTEDDKYASAEFVCEQWTEKNSKLEMGDVVRWWTVDRKKKKASSDVYKVGLNYRAKHVGLMMRSECSVLERPDALLVLEAKSYAE